jgi:hypothetical protein
MEDVPPESVEAGCLLGPLMSVASLLMPIAPIIGLHGIEEHAIVFLIFKIHPKSITRENKFHIILLSHIPIT